MIPPRPASGPTLAFPNSVDDDLIKWCENARRERMKDGHGYSSMLQEFATLGVLPSRGRRRESFGGIE